MSVKFISDLHFCHNNIIPYTIEATNEWRKNGYSVIEPLEKISSIEAYNEYIISRWNESVNADDEVYILGDIILGNLNEGIEKCFSRLNGKKRLIIGNHDNKQIASRLIKFGLINENPSDYRMINVNNTNIVLCHFPIFSFDQGGFGAVHLFGHIHNVYNQNIIYYNVMKSMVIRNRTDSEGKTIELKQEAYNVGAMCPWMNYRPKTLEEIKNDFDIFMKEKSNERLY